MTAGAVAGLGAGFASLPSWTLDENQLADLEMLLSGVFAPLTGFMTAADVSAVCESGTLADGLPWPVPVTLDVPEDAVPPAQRRLALNDPEGVPLAVLDISERSPALMPSAAPAGRSGRHARPVGAAPIAGPRGPAAAGLVRLSGQVIQCRDPEHGPFRQLRRTPAQVQAELGEGPVLAFVTRRPLNARQIGQLRHVAGQLRARLLLLPLVTGTADVVTTPEALVRTVRAATRHLPPGTLVVPLALASRDVSAERELALRALVAAAYGATHLFTDEPGAPEGPDRHPGDVGRRLGLRPGGRGVAAAGPDRARHRSGPTWPWVSSRTCWTAARRCPPGSPRRPWRRSSAGRARRAASAAWSSS